VEDGFDNAEENNVKKGTNKEVLGQSRFNANYFCNVFRVEEICEGVIELDFDVYGDGSLGRLQNPLDSRLGGKKAKSIAFEVQDANRHMKGTLVFRDVLNSESNEYTAPFIFGSNGYSVAVLQVEPFQSNVPMESNSAILHGNFN
jgi:hypothetical protein